MGALVEVHGVCKSFGGVLALSDCSLSVERGKIAALIGPNGSGKTTLFNVVTGYLRVGQGEVRYDGKAITNARPDTIFKLGIARTFQLSRVFAQLSVLENVLVATQSGKGWVRSMVQTKGSKAERKRALEALEFVGLAGKWQLPELALCAEPCIIHQQVHRDPTLGECRRQSGCRALDSEILINDLDLQGMLGYDFALERLKLIF